MPESKGPTCPTQSDTPCPNHQTIEKERRRDMDRKGAKEECDHGCIELMLRTPTPPHNTLDGTRPSPPFLIDFRPLPKSFPYISSTHPLTNFVVCNMHGLHPCKKKGGDRVEQEKEEDAVLEEPLTSTVYRVLEYHRAPTNANTKSRVVGRWIPHYPSALNLRLDSSLSPTTSFSKHSYGSIL